MRQANALRTKSLPYKAPSISEDGEAPVEATPRRKAPAKRRGTTRAKAKAASSPPKAPKAPAKAKARPAVEGPPAPPLDDEGRYLLSLYSGEAVDPKERERQSLVKVAKATAKSRVLAAREDPNAFMEYAFRDSETGAPLRQAAIHREFQNAMAEGEDGVYLFPRDHGKCVPGDALITLSTGRRVKASQLPAQFETRTWCEADGWKDCKARKFAERIKNITRIKTRAGRIERTSSDHPYWTQRGWIQASDLVIGDFVACARGMPCGDVREDLDKAFLLGVVLGDGGLTQSSRVGVTVGDEKTARAIGLSAQRLGWKFERRKGTKHDYALTGIKGSTHGEPVRYFRDLNLLGKSSREKVVPDVVFSWDRESIAAMISGYIEADGTIGNGNAGRCVELYSVSKDLLQGFQSLFLRLNVWARLSKKKGTYKDDQHISWRLTIGGSSIDALADAIPIRSLKTSYLMELRSDDPSNDSLDLIPDALLDRLLKDRFKKVSPRLDTRRKRGHQRRKVLARCDRGSLLECNAKLGWDEVVDVRTQSPEKTYSIEVEGLHTHLVGDIVTHNTTQFEGHAIWRLGNNPNLRTKIVCASDSKAVERLFTIIQHIRLNSRVHDVFPWLKPAELGDWTKHKIVVARDYISRDASIEALGVLSTATGGRADLLLADDVVDRRNALELPKLRETVKVAWDSDWSNLLEPNAQCIYVATPWHKGDLTHKLKKNPAYRFMSRAIGTTSNPFEPIWEEKWPEEALRRRREKIGKIEFDRGFRLVALSGEYATVQKDWIKYWDTPPDLGRLVVFQAFDISSGTSADFFADVTVGVDPRTLTIYVLEATHAKLTFLKRAEAVESQARRWRPAVQGVEQETMSSLSQYLDETTLLSIVPLRPHLSKQLRLLGVTPLLERAQVLFNPALAPERILNKEEHGDLVGELLDFPLAPNDDLVDAFVHAIVLAQHFGLGAADDGGLDLGVSVIGAKGAGQSLLPDGDGQANGNGSIVI